MPTSTAPSPPRILVAGLGRVPYGLALDWQHRIAARRRADRVEDVLLMVEHDPVYTAGRHADVAAHVLGTTAIPVVPTDRGGDVTYHGPGQVVAYPILRLDDPKGVRGYVTALLEAAVRTAARYGVEARADLDRAGAWIGDAKLAAVGIRVEGAVTSHGIAFNVRPDLSHFGGIVPCGIADASVCSLASLGVEAGWEEVATVLADELAVGLERRATRVAPETLGLPPTRVAPEAPSLRPLMTEAAEPVR